MRGRPPKSDATRRRQNRSPSARTLPSVAESATYDVPALPARTDGREWHVRVVEWWATVWTSPMAAEFLEVDLKGGLSLLAELYQIRWTAESVTAVVEAAKEIRLQESRFGLSPFDRRRLQWVVTPDEGAPPAPKGDPRRKDPRGVLSLA